MSAQKDMAQARSMRALAKDIKDPVAKLVFEDAAVRFEKRAAKGASKAARRKKPKKPIQVLG